MADKYNSLIGKLFGLVNGKKRYAVTFGQTTYYSVSEEAVNQSATWRLHENWHKEQYAKEGFFTFLVKYIYYSIRYGYHNNPFEVEAREKAEEGK